MPTLEHEAAIYKHLQALQGCFIPVFLGSVDLANLNRTYYFDFGVHLTYMLLLSWGGDSLGDDQMRTAPEAVAQAVMKLHDLGVLHRDIRRENVLWNLETQGPMIIDFGNSTQLPGPRRHRPPLNSVSPNKRAKVEERKHQETSSAKSKDLAAVRSLFATCGLRRRQASRHSSNSAGNLAKQARAPSSVGIARARGGGVNGLVP